MQHDDQPELMPTAIDRDGEGAIEITWSDDSKIRWTVAELRDLCPCATCREKRKAEESPSKEAPSDEAPKQDAQTRGPLLLPVLSAAEAQPLRIESMSPVGSYAYGISFSDGHSSGIFPFDILWRKPSDT